MPRSGICVFSLKAKGTILLIYEEASSKVTRFRTSTS